MSRYLTRYLLCLNAAGLLFSCNTYRNLQKIQTGESCVYQFKPEFSKAIYKTSADVEDNHISGLLIIKSMPDSSTRIVFTNEMGFPYFDFGFPAGHGFVLYQITPKLNNKFVIRTLRKDFELILFRNMDSTRYFALTDSLLVYHAYPQASGINYYITDAACRRLVKMQRASNKKPVVEASFLGSFSENAPDSMVIRHLNFKFTITLKKISGLVTQ
jgi:hypothetical protein